MSFAVTASAQNLAPGSGQVGAQLPVGALQMPLVTPDQAAAFLAARVVPPSDVPATVTPQSAGEAPAALDIEPVLGHELPTDATAPAGFGRADFAQSKPASDKKQEAVGGAAAVSSRSPSSVTIQQQPPLIGRR